jgi:hypothetical protein
LARKKNITPRRRLLFLAELKRTGRVTAAAKKGEMNRSSWYDLAERDPDFKMEWDDGLAEYLDAGEAEAWRRGIDGVEKKTPYVHVISVDDKETRFHTQMEKSDRLLEFCLKNRHPHFKPTQVLEHKSDGTLVPTAVQPNVDNLSTEELEELIRLQKLLHAPPDPVTG